jgi:hypothetical protein
MHMAALPQAGAAIGVLQSRPTVESITILEGQVIEGSLTVDGSVTAGSLVNTPIDYGTSAAPIAVTAAGIANEFYGSSSSTTGDNRLIYARQSWSSTGSGETLRAFSQVTGANGATGGTINGAHISLSINGSGTISGAGNALRATLGGSSTAPGGTISAIQVDSDFASGGTWTGASFLRFTNSGTGVIDNLFRAPAAMFVAHVSADSTHTLQVVDSAGVPYYVMCTNVAP